MIKFFENMSKNQAYFCIGAGVLLILIVLAFSCPSLLLALVTILAIAGFSLRDEKKRTQAAAQQLQQQQCDILTSAVMEAIQRISANFPQLNFSPDNLYHPQYDFSRGFWRLRIYIPRKKNAPLDDDNLADFLFALQTELNRLVDSGVADLVAIHQYQNRKFPPFTVTLAANVGRNVVTEITYVTTQNAERYCQKMAECNATQSTAADAEDNDVDFG